LVWPAAGLAPITAASVVSEALREWTAGPPGPRSPSKVRSTPSRNGLAGSHDRAVHPVGELVGRLDLDIRESRGAKERSVFGEAERSGDASHVRPARGPVRRRQFVVGHDV